jgi:hypothetical protein
VKDVRSLPARGFRVERDLVRELVGALPRRLFGLCVYCGFPCTGQACLAHQDLLVLDPVQLLDPTLNRH